jgi:tetratricopeptide (TPR) repeat protein
MPHVSELQERYADYGVRVVGVSREELKVVTDFLAKEDQGGATWNDKMRYTVAVDPDDSVNNDYMKAAGQNGIPTSFIVGKDGHVEWIGHPMRMDEPLAAVVRDTWDRTKYKTEFEATQKAEAAQRRMQTQMRELTKAGDWAGIVKLLDEALAESPDNFALQMQKFEALLIHLDRATEAYALADQMAAKAWDNAQMLNALAWTVVDTEGIKTRNLDFALRTAVRASELTKDKDGAILDTVARCHFEKGNLKEAVEIQRKAVEYAPAGPMADELKANLEKYEKALAAKGKTR